MKRTAIRKVSLKRLASLGGTVPYSTISKKSGKPKAGKAAVVRRRRTKKDFARIYGSKARVEWVKRQPCVACGVVGYSENAHVAPKGEAGTGYKADAKWIVPLCAGWGSMRYMERGYYCGCHTLYDDYPWIFVRKFPDFDAEKACAETARQWEESQ